jgi:septum formation protein
LPERPGGAEPSPAPRLILASVSPRRRELLGRLGVPFEVRSPGFDEAGVRHLRPTLQAQAAARGKATALLTAEPDAFILAADTVVALDGAALGQPADEIDAGRMLQRLSGRRHRVITAACLIGPTPPLGEYPVLPAPDPRVGAPTAAPNGRRHRGGWSGRRPLREAWAVSDVRFRPLSGPDLTAYLAGGEWRGKAGAYAIQGRAGSFAEVVRGDFDTVVGLSLRHVVRLLRELGWAGPPIRV